jgi:predicted lipid carrier protein YhbT
MTALPTPLLAALSRLGPRLPPMLVSAHLAACLEVARLLRWLSPPAELEGKRFCITVTDLHLRHHFTCNKQRFRPQRKGDADLTLSASASDFIDLLLGKVDADTLFFQRRLSIAGDTELGLIVKNWLDATERPAWLERLAGRID